jgi:two-component system chemotaxis sensor kinase CheA
LEIQVPVSISTHRLLLIESFDRTFAVPVRSIRSLVHVEQVHTVEGKQVILHESKPIPLATLSAATDLPGKLLRGEDGQFRVALLHSENRMLALYCERFVSEVNALIKPLPHPASLSPHFAGGVILDDGRVALVLNVNTLLNNQRGESVAEEKTPLPATPRRPVVLVVDDSFTARTLQKSILDTAGYAVRVAVDGEAALSILRAESIDAVVSDIQMPKMDGFGLLASMKNHVRLSEIPVVLVTSLSSKEDQERGLSLGASAYIVKERFDHRELLETIRQLV